MWGLNFIRNINGNTKTIAKNAFYSFVIRGFALAISFFSTPAFIRYFQNNEVLGVWYTLLSILTWFLAFDLGVGNGIRNHLVIAIAEKKKENIKQILASGFASVIGITLILTIVGWWLICTINLNSLFNIPDNLISSEVLRKCTILVFIAIMMRFMLTTVSSIFYALQRSAVNSFLSLCVSILQFLFIIAFHYENVETALVNISWAYLLICNLPVIVAGIWVFFTDFKDCRPTIKSVTKEAAKKIMGIGLIFFFCQIFYLIIANTNEFFVSHYWSPTATADYSFYYRIIMLVSMGVSLALTPTWSMITKAYAEKNYHWLKKLYRSCKLVGYFIILAEFALVPFLQPIMDIWLGKGQLTVELSVSIAFACFGATFLYSSMLSTIVCGLAKMKLQFWCYGIGSLLKIAFIIIIARISSDWAWVVWSNVFILLPYCVLQQLQLNRLFAKLKDA
ncbi:MAG: MATE family efflux transporter [Muribaculaceae bacterium]|nr:MATE family efflux transporter [Muribaculaceae bacterium]